MYPKQVNGILYGMHSEAVGLVERGSVAFDSSIIPVVLLPPLHEADLTKEALQDMLDRAQQSDDVLTDEFRARAVFQVPPNSSVSSYTHKVSSLGLFDAAFRYGSGSIAITDIPAPYFIQGSDIHQAWRLYEDRVDAFVLPIIPENIKQPSRFVPLNMFSSDGLCKLVAVPSRLYESPSDSRPLAGKRFTIKDVLDMEGLQTTLASRDYVSLYGPATTTADYVTKLIALGAVIVGKTKTTQFATGDEWIDVHMPTNPRGDEYQFPDGSSTGAAVSLAAYSWVDASIGTDSGGSIRGVAACNGLFSLRSSFGTTSLKGVHINSRHFDVIGLLDRSISSLWELASLTFELKPHKIFPRRILYPTDFFPHEDASQQAMVNEFMRILEDFLDVKHTRITIADEWRKKPPKEAFGMQLEQFLDKNVFAPLCHDYYAEYSSFQTDFQARFNKKPYAGPTNQLRFDVGKNTTQAEAEQGWQKQRIFRAWFQANIMTAAEDTLSTAVMLMPYGHGGPQYRDTPDA
ncbi:hypothetical protein N0V90_001157 [Kalmusia sp. IMI 367209]|nr:hypothetical protein N0V90_001157 [Kalmusia sp. IMI 367209]